jgi:hypothetical protein
MILILATMEVQIGGSPSKAGSGKKPVTLSEKQPKEKRTEGVVQVTEYMHNKHEVCEFKLLYHQKKKIN